MAETRANIDPIVRLALGANRHPFDPQTLEVWPAIILHEAEAERISLLREFADVLTNGRLLVQVQEHYGGDLWYGAVNFVANRNEFRRRYLPGGAPEEPDDQRYAAEFFYAPDPERASWHDIHLAAAKRDAYLRQLELHLDTRIND